MEALEVRELSQEEFIVLNRSLRSSDALKVRRSQILLSSKKGRFSMYLVRRIARTEPRTEWEVAALLAKICEAYEDNGRSKAQIYIGGRGLPGESQVIAEWTQDAIEPNWISKVPASVAENNSKLQKMIKDYPIEFYEVVTPEKLQERGLA